jgi:drug/metabolite transporter (DMT)-like permease
MPLRGIGLMVGATVFFSASDVITKVLTANLPAVEVAWLRYVTFVLLVFPLATAARGFGVLASRGPALQVMRGLAVVVSALLFTTALRYLPVAEATSIYFISPILITALSIPFLGEVVGWRRWSAAAVGLLGVLVVIRPGSSSFQTAALLPLLGATSWASAAIATRLLTGRDHALATLAWSAAVGFLVLSLAVPFVWVAPGLREVGLGVAIGALSTLGHWLVILSFRSANVSVVAPFSYAQLIWAGALGYLVFGSLPDQWTIIGAVVIAASGLYTAYRERVRSARR